MLAEFWIEVMRDRSARMADRLRASEYLADRAFGKAMGALPSDDQAPASPPEIYRMPTHKRLVALVRLAAELEPGIFDGVDHRVDAETAGGSLARTTRPTP